MKRFTALLLLAGLAPLAQAQSQSLFADIPSIEQGLTSITGLQFKRPVPSALMTKDQLRRDFEQRIKASIKPADLHAEEITLKLLGLAPADFDLRQNTIDLLTEQAAAFYDYNKKKLSVLEESGNSAEERIALVHELAHALADQHFPLGKYVHDGLRSDDGATARMAVMEGQASWLMAAYLYKQSGGESEGVPPAILGLMTQSIETSAADYPVFSKAPLYIRESLTFPYVSGMTFQNAVFEKLGRESFAEVFIHPPVSTHQILHPEVYLDHTAPKIPDLPPMPGLKEFQRLGEGTLGELEYRVLLTQYVGADDGTRTAGHLAGSAYAVLESKRDKSPALAFSASWDSEQAAQEYFAQYRRVLEGKWKKLEISSESPAEVVGHGDSGYFHVWLAGATVNHLEGWQTPLH